MSEAAHLKRRGLPAPVGRRRCDACGLWCAGSGVGSSGWCVGSVTAGASKMAGSSVLWDRLGLAEVPGDVAAYLDIVALIQRVTVE